MKYIPILFILFLLGCSQKPNLQKQIELQKDLIELQYINTLNDIDVHYATNPVKYEDLFGYVQALRKRFNALEEELLRPGFINDEISKAKVHEYYKYVSLPNYDRTLDKEFRKCKAGINELFTSKTQSREEKELLVLYLKTFQNFLVRTLLDEMSVNDFKFNKIRPVVVEKSNKVKLGEEYEARIFLAAIDTTKVPLYKIENCEVFLGIQGEGIVRYKTNSKGNHVWDGTVSWVSDQGIEVVMKLEEHFIVE